MTSAVLFSGLANQPPSLGAADWGPEINGLIEQRLQGVALDAARKYGWVLGTRDRQRLNDSAFDSSARTAQMAIRSSDALAALAGAGLPFVVTKGPGIAQFAGGIARRPFSDIDILVPKEFLRPATNLLAQHKYAVESRNTLARPYFQEHCQEAINLKSPDGGSIDLHHTIPPWYWGERLQTDRIIAAAETQSLFGLIELPIAAPVHNLLISALHLVSDRNLPGSTLMAWRDVAVLAAACQPDVVAKEAERAGLNEWLRWVLRSFPPDVRADRLLEALPELHDLRGAERLRALTSRRRGTTHLIPQVMLRLPARKIPLYLAGMVVPSTQFLRAKCPETTHPYISWWRRRC